MSFARLLLRLALVLGATFMSAPAAAATVVTDCGTDVAEQGGVNIEEAVEAAGDFTIRCATGGNEIKFTRVRYLTGNVTIDGEQKVTLIGPGDGAMFRVQPNAKLTLKGLTIRNSPANPSDPAAFTAIVFQPDDRISVDLDSVEVRDTRIPFVAEWITARHSRFVRNGQFDNPTIGAVMAAKLSLYDVTFEANSSRPFNSLASEGLSNAVFRGRVVNCLFRGNKVPAQWRLGTSLP